MKIGTTALLVLTVLALATSASAYYTVSTISTSPSGDLTPQETTTVTLLLNFTAPTEKGSFNSTNNLNFVTDLKSPTWQMTLTMDGVSRATVEKTGKSVYYNGYSISQPPGVKETMTVILKGYAPSTSENGTINLVTIQESDEYNRVVNGTSTSYPINLVSATPTPTPVPTTIATTVTTIPTTLPPTTVPTTVVTTPTPTSTPSPGVLQTVKSLPLMYLGIGVLILVIVIVVIVLIARRNRDYEEEYEDDEEEEYDDDDDYEDRRRR